MICFNCGFKLPSADIDECQICGMKFSLKCPSCGHPNPSHASFCFSCGSRLTKPGEEEGSFESLPENRRNAAVIFADVSGFTALSEKMDPEEVRELINDCFNYITKPVYELEGTIDKYIGDCVMILFGARYAHNDDPKRAVTCAIKMMESIDKFSRERLSQVDKPITMSIGINYGLVVTGSVGNYFDKDYTVIGDVVNTAQRLQSNADRGNILVSESVYLETRDHIHYSDEKSISVKNKEKPVKCYSPMGFKLEAGFDEIQLVERDDELKKLTSIFNAGTGTRHVIVTGEPGIGKTSLIKKFVSGLESSLKKIQADCSPMHKNRMYYVISNMLFGIMNIDPGDNNRVKRNRLASYIDYVLRDSSEEEVQKNFHFLSLIMGLDRDSSFENILGSMDYADMEREISRQVYILFKNLCERNNMVFIAEDLQWADAGSIQILKNLVKSADGIKTTFLLSSRDELWESEDEVQKQDNILRLHRLSEDGVRSFTCSLTDCVEVDRGLLDYVNKFSSGNPLYIKELLTSLGREGRYYIKDGTAYIERPDSLSLPGGIENLILSNLSELDGMSAAFLQCASVVGREFNLSWVAGIMDEAFDEPAVLKIPLKLNIISLKYVHASHGVVDKIYIFNQDTLREVLYGSILNKNKREMHRRVGEYIESHYFNEIENYYEILYFHYDNSGLSRKAMDYLYKTALKYKNNFNYESSLIHFKKLIQALDKKGRGDSKLVHILMDAGYVCTVMAEYDDALGYFNEALKIAELTDDIYTIKAMAADVYKEKGMYEEALSTIDSVLVKVRQDSSIYGRLLQVKCSVLSITGSREAIELARKSEKILLKSKDYENLSETMSQAGIIFFIEGSMDNSLAYLNKAFKYAQKANNLRSMSRVSTNLGIVYHASGMTSKALEYFNESIEVSKKISSAQGIMFGNTNLGILYMEKGMFDRAEKLFDETLEISRRVSSVYQTCVALINMGDLAYEKGLYDRAAELYSESLEIAKKHSLNFEEGALYVGLGKLNLRLEHYDTSVEFLNKAYSIFTEIGAVPDTADYFRYMSVYNLANSDYKGAMEQCEKSISISSESKNGMKELKALRLKGNILMETGEYDHAVRMYLNSVNLAVGLESDYEAAKGYYRMYQAYKLLGDNDNACSNIEKAREAASNVDNCRWASDICGICK